MSAFHQQRFDEFWAAYPRRVAKLDAKRKYDAALKHASAEEIIAGAQAYARVTAGTDMKFIKHPATWLRAGGWMDDMAHVAPRGHVTAHSNSMAEMFGNMEQFFDGQQDEGRDHAAAQGSFLSLPFDGRKH